MYQVKRSDEEINRVLNKAAEQEEMGGTRYRGMTFEQGVQAALLWVFGDWDDEPMHDETDV